MTLSKLKNKILGDKLPIYTISKSPLIIISYWHDFITQYEKINNNLLKNHSKAYLIFQLGWHRETNERVLEIKNEIERLDLNNSKFELIFLTNSEIEKKLFDDNKLISYFCHQNAFLDEHTYKITKTEKKYDALYIARITPFKRHYLCTKLTNLLIIGNHSSQETDFYEKTIAELATAEHIIKVHSYSIYKYINSAKTGLCLSNEEGAMFVSAEYLLCGVPVVNTKNMGGRDHFFNENNSITLENDTPENVAEAVNALIKKNLSPKAIREDIISNFIPHRKKFISIIQKIYKKEKCNRDFSKEWSYVFIHKFGLRTSNFNLNSLKKLYNRLFNANKNIIH